MPGVGRGAVVRLIAGGFFVGSAQAAEVVWLEPPLGDDATWVGELAGATRGPLLVADLRSAATDWRPADDAALGALSDALEAVRMYETRLDGELVIMRELDRADAAVGAVRSEAHREARFKVLAYQGFAVERYFGANLSASEAAPYVVDLGDGRRVARPWADAVASHPTREVTPYDIAEAPQRVAFGAARAEVLGVLPAAFVPTGLPDGARLFVDGAPATPGPTGSVRVPPGRHLAHLELDGRIVDRFDVRLAPGEERAIAPSLADADLTGWLAAVRRGEAPAPPAGLRPHVAALGGEVWLAVPGEDVAVWVLTGDAVAERDVERPKPPREQDGGWSVAVGVGAGWLASGNFALDAPGATFDRATVNAGTVAASAAFDYDRGTVRVGAGVEVAVPLGEDHVARYGGDRTLRARPYPFVAAGLRPVQATLGWVFPHHPTVGLRAQLPLTGDLEVGGSYWLGIPTLRARDGAADYVSKPLYAANVGVTWRLGP